MSYQVLARKWRPRRFSELVGQEHVVRALTHALDTGRVHHAFLFSGTRGVGKTTIARIFAKSLNCERGVSADPCGECSACRDIDAGRYVDLLEIDAASRTKVDDTRDLLENVVYAPSRGRYKVYLIDEVHMLSGHSFNALLKTLEEPPEHVKFLLATTDPQKLPVTVLSRCLQFNLKRLSEAQIEGQLLRVVEAEGIASEQGAIEELARAGNGSMRDALSLLDQAVSHGGGSLTAGEVRAMLGTVARADVARLLRAIALDDAAGLLAAVEQAAEFVPDFGLVMDELARLLHGIALAQALGERVAAGEDGAVALEFSARLRPEEVQLLYQLAVTGRRDLALAPSPRAGFEMVLLRMLTFRRAADTSEPAEPKAKGAQLRVGEDPAPGFGSARDGGHGPSESERSIAAPAKVPQSTAAVASRPAVAPAEAQADAPKAPGTPDRDASAALTPAAWAALAERLSLRGPARELALNASLVALAGTSLKLALKPQHENLRSASTEAQLCSALTPHLGVVKLEFRVGEAVAESAAERIKREREAKQAVAEAALQNDPIVSGLIEVFGARIVPGSVRAAE